MDLKHISHDHPLVFIQDWSGASEEEEEARCSACEEGVEGPCYRCSGCKFYLHKTCAELELSPEIKHPFHPSHPLILLPKSPYSGMYRCYLCGGSFSGLVYHCASCQFDLDISCASIAGNFDKLLLFSHPHRFIFIENHNRIIRGDCLVCRKEISSDPFYACLDCGEVYLHKKCTVHLKHGSHDHPLVLTQDATDEKRAIVTLFRCLACGGELKVPFYYCSSGCRYYLHKTCAELVSSLEVSHPIHSLHPLILKLASSDYKCDLCREHIFCEPFPVYRYHCASCDFNLDVKCASVGGNFGKLQHPSHDHPFIFIETHDTIIKANCLGCLEEISSDPFYKCLDCLEVYLHKKCADLPLEIDNFQHRGHLLQLQKPPIHSESCSCYLCKFPSKKFVYCCEVCEFILTLEDALSLPKIIKSSNHDHPWTPLLRQMSFICDFCGINDGDNIPYICTTCNFIVHKDCISLRSTIAITRHHHRLTHSYSLKRIQFEKYKCRICFKEVNTRYMSYYCPVSNCSYIAHVNCATHPSIWDSNYEDEWFEGESINWIMDVIHTKSPGGEEIVTEIKHAFHDHNLVLTFSGAVKDDSNCDGCMRPISTPFYACKHCEFFLHKNCTELPRKKRHPSHMHVLTLSKDDIHTEQNCSACYRDHHGFSYMCNQPYCSFKIDIQCSSLSDTLTHPSHKHLLFLDNNCEGNCIGCREKIQTSFAYKCTEGCGEFMLEFYCITLPLKFWCKYDKHLLSLSYDAGSDPDQFYCDICEEERDPKKWFYSCTDCDTSTHLECILGVLPLIKIGRRWKTHSHTHPLTFVKNIWNCHPCIFCKKLCYGQALQCTQCNFNIHWKCKKFVGVSQVQSYSAYVNCATNLSILDPNHEDEWSEGESMNGITNVVSKYDLTIEDSLPLPEIIESANHEHPWTLLSRQIPFTCDFCGIDGDNISYMCTTCNFIIHKDCISLPSTVMIMRHHHRLCHSYSLQFKEYECKICYMEVNTEYGSYFCSSSDCSYNAHVSCAITYEVEWSEEESVNWNIDVTQRLCQSGGEGIATEIKHAFHDHNLILNFIGKIEDDSNCDGCMSPISTPFYGCKECEFFLHKSCAELPRKKLHPSHNHILTLSKNEDYSICGTCQRFHHGFSYKCNPQSCDFEIDIRCSVLSDSLWHPSHEHLLFLDYNCHGNCIGCRKEILNSCAYKCTKGCDKFMLDFNCLTLPQIGWYKNDKHPLTLIYDAGHDQFYCDICEEERDPRQWFYSCPDCDNSAHSECILGELPYIKVGRTLETYLNPHEHHLTFVKNSWNCPPCNVCEKLCYVQALQCTQCNFNLHWRCSEMLLTNNN